MQLIIRTDLGGLWCNSDKFIEDVIISKIERYLQCAEAGSTILDGDLLRILGGNSVEIGRKHGNKKSGFKSKVIYRKAI